MHVVLSEFSVRLFYLVHAQTLCRYDCIYFFAAPVLVCVCRCDGDVICIGHAPNVHIPALWMTSLCSMIIGKQCVELGKR